MQQLQSAFGILALIAFAFAISERRGAVPWRKVVMGLGVTVVLAVVLLKVPPVRELFAGTQEARARGYQPGRVSVNVKGGRGEAGQGGGKG